MTHGVLPNEEVSLNMFYIFFVTPIFFGSPGTPYHPSQGTMTLSGWMDPC